MSDRMNRIEDEDNLLANSTMIPNIIDDMDLSAYAVRLYVRMKRRVKQLRSGETEGAAYDSTKNLASACHISAGTVSKGKKELVEAGLIRIEKVKRGHGEFDYDKITIVDIWGANKAFYVMDGSANTLKIVAANETYIGEAARKFLAKNPALKRRIPEFIKSFTG